MGENSKIEWCHHTMNPWRGCTKIAAGCEHCYADALSKRNPSVLGIWGPNGKRVRAADAHWQLPIKWNKAAALAGERHRVFCASLADVFEDWQQEIRDSKNLILHRCDKCGSTDAIDSLCAYGCDCGKCDGVMRAVSMNTLRADLFKLIDATPNLDWLLLTKRPENVLRMWPSARHMPAGDEFELDGYRPNVWLLTSIATQADADKNVPELLKCRDLVPVLGLSAEPLIGPVDFGPWMIEEAPAGYKLLSKFYGASGFDEAGKQPERTFKLRDPQLLDWVIVGGESGHGARPFDINWARSIVAQCKAAGVPVFVKQLGANVVVDRNDEVGGGIHCLLKKKLHDKKGGDISEFPADLRVREFPQPISRRMGRG